MNANLEAAGENILDLYDYVAGQKYVRENKGGAAVILTNNDEEKIAADPDYQEELAQINADKRMAQTVRDWSEILRRRY